jgi:hypothetical protein
MLLKKCDSLYTPDTNNRLGYYSNSLNVRFFFLQKCRLTILDDEADPKLEGNETFSVFLSSPIGSILSMPYMATVSIYDNALDSK